MNTTRSIHLAAFWALLLALTPLALAQQQQQIIPHIGYIYPAGGRQGTTFQVTVGGQFLDGVASVHFSGAGAQAKVIEHVKPLTPKEFAILKEKLDLLLEKRRDSLKPGVGGKYAIATTRPTWSAEDEKTLTETRKRLAGFQRRPSSAAIAEVVTLEVTLAADAAPGVRELRLGTTAGLTNPMVFHVGQVAEVVEKEARTSAAAFETSVTLPAVVNGQIMPGDADRYRFPARKGQHLVVIVHARSLIPYIADAVPGWFQATVALKDARGNEIAFADDYRFNPDPMLHWLIPADGEYVVEVRDSIYRGREDFVYRIAMGELPFVTSIFPLGGKAGTKTPVELKGWNLPVTRLLPDTSVPGVHEIVAKKAGIAANCMPFAVDELPEMMEREPNDQPASAQTVAPGAIINGRIDKPGDWDIYRVEGVAGSEIIAEVHARRLNSPVDSLLKLTDAAGKQLALNDDHEDKGSGLHTHHADSRVRFMLPASGAYFIHITDAQHQGGPEHAYRLRISGPRPDFELRVTPASVSVRPGATVPLTVYALRQDGFAGEIALSDKDLPAGFRLSGARIPAGADQVRITLTAPTKAPDGLVPLKLQGSARIAGRPVVREAVPAEDMMQAFAYRHLVPAEQLLVSVGGRWGQRNQIAVLSPLPVKIPAGGTARVQVTVPSSTFMGKVELSLSDPPEGLTLRSTSPSRGGTEIILQADPAKLKPGTAGNLIIQAFAERQSTTQKDTKRRTPLGTLPAIPFEVVGR